MQKCLLEQRLSDKLFYNKEVDKSGGEEEAKRINANLEAKVARFWSKDGKSCTQMSLPKCIIQILF